MLIAIYTALTGADVSACNVMVLTPSGSHLHINMTGALPERVQAGFVPTEVGKSKYAYQRITNEFAAKVKSITIIFTCLQGRMQYR